MKATDYLKKQHREVERLFAAIEEASDGPKKQRLFEELAANLVAHDAIEREIFYPMCEDEMGLTDLLGESLVEHGLIEFGILRADENLGGEYFEHFVSVLKENVNHHVQEEEKALFPKVEKVFDKQTLEDLAARMDSRFTEAMAEDYRGPLVENVRQVMTGALKTSPEGVEEQPAARAGSSSKTKSGAQPARR